MSVVCQGEGDRCAYSFRARALFLVTCSCVFVCGECICEGFSMRGMCNSVHMRASVFLVCA